jgi:hypothetical protein
MSKVDVNFHEKHYMKKTHMGRARTKNRDTHISVVGSHITESSEPRGRARLRLVYMGDA